MTHLVKAVGVKKHFGDFTALHGIDLEVNRGQVICILGPSGSGKSTFLRCINQLETADEGAIWVDGELMGYNQTGDRLQPITDKEVAAQRRHIGMVFQRFNLFAHMTVLENIIEGTVGVLRRNRSDAIRQAQELLKRVGLESKANSYPNALSGGQQQRVAIARAMAMEPKLMLFDEPTSALDPELVGEVLSVMRQLAESGMTMIVVTHELGFAREVADKLMFMDEGRVIDFGEVEEVLNNPTHHRTEAFLAAVLS